MKIKKKLAHPMLGGIVNYDLQQSLNSIVPSIDKVVTKYIEDLGAKKEEDEVDISKVEYQYLILEVKKAIRDLFKV